MSYRNVCVALTCLLASIGLAVAQPQPPAGPTPPVQPRVQETPLPPPIELPGPETVPADLPNRPLTAAEAALLALHYQPTLVGAAAGVTAAQARTQETRAASKATLGIAGSYAHTITHSTGTTAGATGTAAGYLVSATGRQLLYDFNHTRDLVRQARANERFAGATLTRAQADLVLQVKQGFYVYLEAVHLVAVNEDNVENQEAHLALAQARLNTGLGLPVDVSRAQAAKAEAIFNLTSARANATQARVNLAESIGVDPRVPFVPADSSEPAVIPVDPRQLTLQALKQRPEIAQAQANIEAAAYAVSAARTTNAPAVVGSVGVLQRGSDFPPAGNAVTVGVAVQWTPFDGGFTKGRVQETQANLTLAQSQMASTRLGVIADVSSAYLALKTAEEKIATADAEIANAEEALRLARGRYQAGIGVFIDIIDAQTTLETAHTNRVNAVSAVDQARAAMAHAVGNPIPKQ